MVPLIVLVTGTLLAANIYAAQEGVTFRGTAATPLLPRIALQALFIAAIWWAGVRRPGAQPVSP